MPNSAEVLSQIDQFKLIVNEDRVWTPYGIFEGDHSLVFLQAKGTPQEMQLEVANRIKKDGIPDRNEKAARQFLSRKPSVSIDCSGFVFHVLNGLTIAERPGLAEFITIPREEVLQAARKPQWMEEHELTTDDKKQLKDFGENIPLEWVYKKFNKTPQSQTNVARLASHTASKPVTDLADIHPADMIVMSKDRTPNHIALVGDINGNEIEIWDSGKFNGDIDDLGGVGSRVITIVDLEKSIKDQVWFPPLGMNFDAIEVRRSLAFTT